MFSDRMMLEGRGELESGGLMHRDRRKCMMACRRRVHLRR